MSARSSRKKAPSAAKRAENEAMIEQVLEGMLAQLGSDGLKFPKSTGRLSGAERAQDVIWEAMDSDDPEERLQLARKAISISPHCADAYVMLAEESDVTDAERLELLRKAEAGGAKALGKRAFEEDVGHFWGLIETRPYMRALHGLASALWAEGLRDESIQHYQELLRLNPNDNQGARYELIDRLVTLGRFGDAARLLKEYKNDGAASWAYARALLAFAGGDAAKAAKQRAAAVKNNRHLPAYLTGAKSIPEDLPDTYSPGHESEAIVVALTAVEAWASVPGAIDWLKGAAQKLAG